MNDWKSIESCPHGKTVLFWWRPANDNAFAECCIIGSLAHSSFPEMKGKWWNPHTGTYQDLWHVTHWMELPDMPEDRRPALDEAIKNWPKMKSYRDWA